MGSDVKDMAELLENDRCELITKWGVWQKLFGEATSHEHKVLLEEAASTFFQYLKHVLMDDIVLSLCRIMMDPKESSVRRIVRQNLVLDQLLEVTRFDGEARVAVDGARKRLNELKPNIKCIRDRKISHNDLLTRLRSEQLPQVPDKEIGDAVECVDTLITRLYLHYRDTTTDPLGGGADQLVRALRDCQKFRNLVRQKKIPYDELSC